MTDEVEKIYFSVWHSTEGFVMYKFTYYPDYTVWDAFKRTAEESRGWDLPIETEYLGQKIRWSFAFGEHDKMVERLDEDLTFEELGIGPGSVITVSPIEYLGVGDELARIRKDRRQLMLFVEQNSDSLEIIRATPRSFFLRLKGFKGITGLTNDGVPIIKETHDFAVHLGRPHPYEEPLVAPVTPIFHPNVSMKESKICVWVDYKVNQNNLLPLICYQVADLVQYNPLKINLEEPHRLMNEEASNWYEKYLQEHPDFFPLSRRSFRWIKNLCKRCGRPLDPDNPSVCSFCKARQ